MLCLLCKRLRDIEGTRRGARKGQQRAADAMVASTSKRLKPIEEGDTVLIPVSNFDRGRIDHRNIMGYVLDKDETGKMTVGTRHGVISYPFMRNQLEACSSNMLSIEDVEVENIIPLRTAVAAESLGHGQGYFKCSCTGKCANARCSCVKNQQKCNSHCHPTGKACLNHD